MYGWHAWVSECTKYKIKIKYIAQSAKKSVCTHTNTYTHEHEREHTHTHSPTWHGASRRKKMFSVRVAGWGLSWVQMERRYLRVYNVKSSIHHRAPTVVRWTHILCADGYVCGHNAILSIYRIFSDFVWVCVCLRGREWGGWGWGWECRCHIPLCHAEPNIGGEQPACQTHSPAI